MRIPGDRSRPRHNGLGAVLALLIPLVLTPRASAELKRYEFLQIRMGIPVELIFYAGDASVANQAADAAYARLRQLDRTFSDYDPDSELRQLCARGGSGESIPVSEDLMRVLKAAQALSSKTDGAFDTTVGPVVHLWRIARRDRTLPDPKRLEQARKLVGYSQIRLNEEARTVTLQSKEMRIDLGAIAKGDALDQTAKVLASFGITSYLIDASGDILVGNPPPEAEAWKIDIEPIRPPASPRPPLRLHLANCAVATSGDAYQFIEIDGTRYSHIVDPSTGLGLTTRSSVTVIAKTGIEADSLASAVSVLGPKKGLKLIATIPAAHARIVQIVEEREQVTFSPCFRQFVADSQIVPATSENSQPPSGNAK